MSLSDAAVGGGEVSVSVTVHQLILSCFLQILVGPATEPTALRGRGGRAGNVFYGRLPGQSQGARPGGPHHHHHQRGEAQAKIPSGDGHILWRGR